MSSLAISQPTQIKALSFNPLDPIGSILDRALGDVEKTLNQATDKVHDASVDVILRAGEQAARTIASLKGAYADSLNITYQAADKLLRENIDRATDLAAAVISQEQDALLKVADKIGDIIKFSPLSNWWLPLLSNVTPEFFAIEADPNNPDHAWMTQVKVKFSGNFAYADRTDCTPTFTLDGKEYKPASNTTKELTFLIDVPSNHPKLGMHKYSYLSGSLKVIWKSGWFTWTTSEYKTLLGMLPGTPGKIQVIYEKAASSITQTFYSAPLVIVRNKDHWQTDSLILNPNSGWNVVRTTASVTWLDGPHGQVNAKIAQDDNNQVRCEYARKDGSGKIQVSFQESQTVPAQTRVEEHDTLRWGSSFLATPNNGERITQINFDAFNGDHREFQPRTDNSNSFITLREFDGTIEIKAKKASEINDQSVSLKS